jgi:hypothetical protein
MKQTYTSESSKKLTFRITLILSLITSAFFISGLMSPKQETDPTKLTNPKECGRGFSGAKSLRRRFISGVESNQKDWAWQVCIFNSEMKTTGGSLINSQWVLTRAKFLRSAFWASNKFAIMLSILKNLFLTEK